MATRESRAKGGKARAVKVRADREEERRLLAEARRERLSWSHHRAVAQLEPAEHWLARAEREGLSVSKLESDLRSVALVKRGEPLADLEQVQLHLTAPVEQVRRWRQAAAEREVSLSLLAIEALDRLVATAELSRAG